MNLNERMIIIQSDDNDFILYNRENDNMLGISKDLAIYLIDKGFLISSYDNFFGYINNSKCSFYE